MRGACRSGRDVRCAYEFVFALVLMLGASIPAVAVAQGAPSAPGAALVLLVPDRVFTGSEDSVRTGWAVLVRGDRIVAVGPREQLRQSAGARVIDLKGTTLIPGMIEGHTHLFLHPYDETSWNDQVLENAVGMPSDRLLLNLAEDFLSV